MVQYKGYAALSRKEAHTNRTASLHSLLELRSNLCIVDDIMYAGILRERVRINRAVYFFAIFIGIFLPCIYLRLVIFVGHTHRNKGLTIVYTVRGHYVVIDT